MQQHPHQPKRHPPKRREDERQERVNDHMKQRKHHPHREVFHEKRRSRERDVLRENVRFNRPKRQTIDCKFFLYYILQVPSI